MSSLHPSPFSLPDNQFTHVHHIFPGLKATRGYHLFQEVFLPIFFACCNILLSRRYYLYCTHNFTYLQPYSRSCCCASSFSFSVVLLPVTGVQMKHLTAQCSNTQTYTTCKTFQAEQYPGLYRQMTSNFCSQVLTVSLFCWFQAQPVQCEVISFRQLLLSLLINLLGRPFGQNKCNHDESYSWTRTTEQLGQHGKIAKIKQPLNSARFETFFQTCSHCCGVQFMV